MPNVRLVFAGKGESEYEATVRSFILDHGMEGRVIFIGHVSQEEIRELYQCADLALFPTKAQGGWLSPFEAMAAGVPIITKPSLTASSIISENQLGIVCNDFEPKIIKFHDNSIDSKVVAEKAGEWVRVNLSWQAYADKTLDVYFC